MCLRKHSLRFLLLNLGSKQAESNKEKRLRWLKELQSLIIAPDMQGYLYKYFSSFSTKKDMLWVHFRNVHNIYFCGERRVLSVAFG